MSNTISNFDAERAVLGSIMISAEAAMKASTQLDIDDFSDPAHRAIFDKAKLLYDKGTSVDSVTMVDALGNALDSVGGMTYIDDLCVYMPTAANVDHYIGIVREARRRRDLVNGLREAAVMAQDGTGDYLGKAQTVIDSVAALDTGDIKPVGQKAVDAVQALMKPQTNGLLTFYRDVDGITGGFKPGNLIILAARPGVGKTSFALNIALNATSAGKTVLVFTLEMSESELLQRAVISKAKVNRYEAMQSEKAAIELVNAAGNLTEERLLIDERSNSVDRIRARCYTVKQRMKGLDLIVIDYLTLITTKQRRNGTRTEEISEVTRSLKLLAKDLMCPVLLLSQLNREIEKRTDRTPRLSDLRDSGSIEQDADIVLFLHRPYVYDTGADPTDARVIVAKNRNGACGDIDSIKWDGEHFLYQDEELEDTDGATPFDD